LYAAFLPDVDNGNAKAFPAGVYYQEKTIAIMQR